MADDEKPTRGRPPLVARGQPSTPVNVRLPPAAYDATYARSRQAGVSVPAVMRRALAQYLDHEADD
jgi:hypothetical protein